MPGLVSDATRIWEVNIYWTLHSQCGVWDPKGKGVDIWECIRPREYSIVSSEALFRSFVARRQFDSGHSGVYIAVTS